MTENKRWWNSSICCPKCRKSPLPEDLANGICNNCKLGFTRNENTITFHDTDADHLSSIASPEHKKSRIRSFARYLTRPIKALNEKRVERHYQKTLTDLSLAKSWVKHYFNGLDIPEGGRVLDYGCGRGRLLGFFKQLGYSTVGLDMIKSTWWENFHETGFVITPPKLPQIPFCDESFDVVLNIDSTHYFNAERLEQHAKEIKRILRPSGLWIILQVNPQSYNMPPIPPTWHGHFHTVTEASSTLAEVGLHEIDHSFEGLSLPINSKLFNTSRHLLNPWPLNMNDYDSFVGRMIPTEKRHRWLLRVQKPENQ